MTKKDINFNFEDIAIRSRESDGRVWFSVVDTIKVLLSYNSLKQAQVYWRKTKERLKAEGSQCVTECHQLN